MNRSELLKYLEILGGELEKCGLHGEVIITGDAAMCLVHSARDATKDIDALYEPKNEINALVKKIAAEYDLPQDWLNDSVKGFVDGNIETADYMKLGNLKITAVTPEYLLAMKLMSSRVEGQDYNDIKFLLRKLNIRTYEKAELIIGRFFTLDRILPKTRYVIEQSLEELYYSGNE
ncbi:MAG: hypothetical protein LBU70_04415 [Chitinispirillales bacterium]|jgi:hypothetical protein|nr:hypothetical protein [Chitinispirillales bacterium]